MSFTITTTSSPSTLARIGQNAAIIPAEDAVSLTSPFRPKNKASPTSAPAPATAAASSEPPPKRIRLDPQPTTAAISTTNNTYDQQLHACLARQVFPHVDAQIAALPKDRVNTLAIGKQVIAILTGQDFSDEYYRRGDGTISREFEAGLAHQAACHVQALARHLNNRLVPSSTISPVPIPRPPVTIPLPVLQSHRPEAHRAASAPSAPRRYSASPIPLPTIPHYPLDIIIIEDDDDVPPQKPAPVHKRVAINKPGPARQPVIDRPSEPPSRPPLKRGSSPTSPSKSAIAPGVVVSSLPNGFPKLPRVRRNPPKNWGLEAHASVWRGRPPVAGKEVKPVSEWFSKEQRMLYLSAGERSLILAATQRPLHLSNTELATPVTWHVDFTDAEVRYLRLLARRTLRLSTKEAKDPKRDLGKLLKNNHGLVPVILDAFARDGQLPGRTRDDIKNLFLDLVDQKTRPDPAVLTLLRDDRDQRGDLIRSSRVHSLLFGREISGRQAGTRNHLEHFNEIRKCREDDLEKRAEWTGCAGDIFTIAWMSNDGFICGTTEHSDSHNQQYNKPGNLVLGSCSAVTLRAYPDHRIVRPVVHKGENSTAAMRQSQDPWLYSSVVSSDYDGINDRAYTCSFDRTVKIWKAEKSGASMDLLGEWRHSGNVNFVAASKHGFGMVATAADVASDAVRIYNIREADVSGSPFRSYSCSRVTDERGNTVSTEKWAYYPATMQWGLADNVKHLLLVGYSPRSRTGDDNDIPEDRRNSGELCLWDGITGERWRLTACTTQNVFEVLWHPTQDSFIAATSPWGPDLEPSVRTQIGIFRPADRNLHGVNAYSPMMTLDCTAIDVNELTIMPNSPGFSYVTAGCTDGNTYVWDTAISDKPVHILRHGEPIDEYRGDREREDVGVKFTAWGTTPDRFYTGSSDGVVKVWNIRSRKKPLVRNLLEAPAPITAGMFCPDKSRLVVGDASGRVFMLSINEEKEQPASVMKIPLPGGKGFRTIQRPTPIIPHTDPPPPTCNAEGLPAMAETGPALARAYLDSQQLERHPNPTIGIVQGPRYTETGLFRPEMHFNEDPAQPLLARWEAMQQEAWKPSRPFGSKRRDQGIAIRPLKEVADLGRLHERNINLDLDVEALSQETIISLWREKVDFELMGDYLLKEED